VETLSESSVIWQLMEVHVIESGHKEKIADGNLQLIKKKIEQLSYRTGRAGQSTPFCFTEDLWSLKMFEISQRGKITRFYKRKLH